MFLIEIQMDSKLFGTHANFCLAKGPLIMLGTPVQCDSGTARDCSSYIVQGSTQD